MTSVMKPHRIWFFLCYVLSFTCLEIGSFVYILMDGNSLELKVTTSIAALLMSNQHFMAIAILSVSCTKYIGNLVRYLWSAYTNNKINSKKITKPIRVFQLLLGHNIVKLVTYLFAPQIIFKIYLTCWLYFIPDFW